MSCNEKLCEEASVTISRSGDFVFSQRYLFWLYMFSKKHICFNGRSMYSNINITAKEDIVNIAMLKTLITEVREKCKECGIDTKRKCSKDIQFITLRFYTEEYGSYIIQVSFLEDESTGEYYVSYINPKYNLDTSEVINITVE